MTVLLVDTSLKRLRGTAALLQKLIPDSFVMSMADPLLAAKYAFSNPVDVLFAQLNMKRLSGLQICEFVKEKNPCVRICLFASEEEFSNCTEIFDDDLCPMEYPVTEEALHRFLEAGVN